MNLASGAQMTINTTGRIGLGSSQTWTLGAGAFLIAQTEITDFGNNFTLTKDGAGTLLLNRVSTYTGGTVVNQGKLVLNPSSPSLRTHSRFADGQRGGTVAFGGFNPTFGSALPAECGLRRQPFRRHPR